MESREEQAVPSSPMGESSSVRAAAPRHRPLTAFRLARGILLITHLIMTSFVSLVVFAPLLFFLLRFVDVRWSRSLVCLLFGSWLSTYPAIFERINGCKAVFTGDQLPQRERVLLIVNHRTEVDWMYLWSLAYRKDRIGQLRFALKSTVRNVPLFGWAFYCLEFLLLDRRWESDQQRIEAWVTGFQDKQEPLWLVIFPEGTDFSEAKRERSRVYAAKNNLPLLDNVLLPRTRGFNACFMPLRDTLDAVYDLTIGYNYRDPTFLDNLFGLDPAEVHVHARRVSASQMPESEKELEKWVFDTYARKDNMLANFYKTHSFNGVETEGPLHPMPCIVSFVVFGLGALLFFWISYLSPWVRVYTIAVCALLAGTTYLDWKPTPLFQKKLQ